MGDAIDVSMTSGKYTGYYGTFIHSKSKQELEYLFNACVLVGSDGKISHIKSDLAGKDEAKAWAIQQVGESNFSSLEAQGSPDRMFFFPGFIGKFKSCRPPAEENTCS